MSRKSNTCSGDQERSGEIRREQERSGEIRRNQERTGEIRRDQEKSGENRRDQERSGENRREQERSGEIRREQERSGENRRDQERTGEIRREQERSGEIMRDKETMVACNTGAPQGTVLSLLLFTLYTSDFSYNTNTCHLQKFSDDSAVVGCVSDGNEQEYKDVIKDFVDWFCWVGGSTERDRKRLNKLVRRASSVLGCPLDLVEEVGSWQHCFVCVGVFEDSRDPNEECITVIKPGGDKGVDQPFSFTEGMGGAEFGYVTEN
ncbi:hypothetical protein QTP70_011539 [Hemibagrus guttatus]|uniref:Reverse transcriptase domain-containing protein n=1 Tax=Hemibagrus guttatus TaxID=175788 RepID=A0AAE0R126_9TELE|nr:hypothetical protein QTP70_011539 [Hemibagrus guttatus]